MFLVNMNLNFLFLSLFVPALSWECGTTPDREIPPQSLPHNSGRRLSRATDATAPIRFQFYYYNFALGTAEEIATFQDDVGAGVEALFSSILKVYPITGNLVLDGITECGSEVVVPDDHQTTGLADTDLVVYFTTVDAPSESYLAYAGACVTEGGGNNNILAGRMVLNTALFTSQDFITQFSVVAHELTHILGFSASLFETFQKSDGSVYAAEELYEYVTTRGVDKVLFKTPTVLSTAQTLFDCPGLLGAELEEYGASGSPSSHWDARMAYNEYMIAHNVEIPIYSELTFALLQDSGWYEIDWTHVDTPKFGAGVGCSFLDTTCVTDGVANFDEFCVEDGEPLCDMYHVMKGDCYVVTHSSIPAEFQYFSTSTTGGYDEYLDYCPMFLRFGSGYCQDESTVSVQTYYGEVAGITSRCVLSTLIQTGYASPGLGARCYEVVACSDTAATLRYGKDSLGYTEVDCPFTGGQVEAVSGSSYSGYIECPASDVLCSDVPCLNACYGQGTCSNGVCACNAGRGGDDCSVICDASCVSCTGPTAEECLGCTVANCETCESAAVCSVCLSGYFVGTSGQCCATSLDANCVDCSDGVCTACDTGYFAGDSGLCCADSLDSECSDCTDVSTCSACNTGYSLKESGNCCADSLGSGCLDCDGLVCTNCSDETCAGCGENSTAVDGDCVCNSGYYESGGECVVLCDLCSSCESETQCTCVENAVFDSTQDPSQVCSCPESYEQVGSACVALGDYLDTTDLASAEFNSQYTTITVTFHTETVRLSNDGCSAYFLEATTEKLGDEPECIWESSVELVVVLGFGYSLRDGDTVYLNGHKVQKSTEKLNTNYVELTITATGGEYPLPDFYLQGPEAAYLSCTAASITFEATGFTGLALNPGSYEWTIYPSDVTLTEETEPTLTISTSDLFTGTYEVVLNVTNSLGASSVDSLLFDVFAEDGLAVEIDVGSSVTITTSDTITIKSEVVEDCDTDAVPEYEWEYTGLQGNGELLTDPTLVYSHESKLVILPGDLSPDLVYTYTVTARIGGLTGQSSIHIEVLHSDVIADVDKQDEEVSNGVDLIVSGEASNDPDDETLTFAWTCTDQTGGTCTGTDGEALITSQVQSLLISKDRLRVGDELQFTLVVESEDGRSASDSGKVTITEAGTTQVVLLTALPKIITEREFVLRLLVTDGWTVLWDQTNGPGLSPSTSLSSPYLRFAPNTMAGGAAYEYTATVTNKNSQTLKVRVQWATNLGPVCSAGLSISQSGDQYTLKLAECMDQDDSDTPLLYAFGLQRFGSLIPLFIGTQFLEKTVSLLPGTYDFVGFVCDSLWSCTTYEETLVVTGSRRAEASDVETSFETTLFDEDLVPFQVVMYTDQYDLTETEWAFLFEQLEEYTDSLIIFDTVTVDALLTAASALLSEALNETLRLQAIAYIDWVVSLATDTVSAEAFVLVLEGFDSAQAAESAIVAKSVVQSKLRFTQQFASNLPVNDEHQVYKSSNGTFVSYFVRSTGSELASDYSLNIETSGGSYEFTLGDLPQFASTDVVDLDITVLPGTPNDLVEILFSKSGYYEDAHLELSDTPEVMILTEVSILMKTRYEYEDNLVCYYLEGEDWVEEAGCSVLNDEGMAVMQLPHTSMFRLGYPSGQSDDCGQVLLPLYILAALIVIEGVLLLYTFKKPPSKRVINISNDQGNDDVSVDNSVVRSPKKETTWAERTIQTEHPSFVAMFFKLHLLFGQLRCTHISPRRRAAQLIASSALNIMLIGAFMRVLFETNENSDEPSFFSALYVIGLAAPADFVATYLLELLLQKPPSYYQALTVAAWIAIVVIGLGSCGASVYLVLTSCSDWGLLWGVYIGPCLLLDWLVFHSFYAALKTCIARNYQRGE